MSAHDLAGSKEDKKSTAETGPEIVLSNEIIPELDDYAVDDEIEMTVKAKITKIERPQQTDNVSKSVEPADFTLALVTAEITNLSEGRKKADRMGLDMKSFKKVQGKRKGGGGIAPTGIM